MVTFFWGGPILRLFELISWGGVKSEIEDVAGFKWSYNRCDGIGLLEKPK